MSDATLPGDPESPLKFEDVEDWTFIGVGGVSTTIRVHVERGERSAGVANQIDNSLALIQLQLKDGTEKNETAAVLTFVVANLVHFAKEVKKVPVYAKGESPEEKELKRQDDVMARKAELFEQKQAAAERDFLEEIGRK